MAMEVSMMMRKELVKEENKWKIRSRRYRERKKQAAQAQQGLSSQKKDEEMMYFVEDIPMFLRSLLPLCWLVCSNRSWRRCQ
jgi:hypothetical protein